MSDLSIVFEDYEDSKMLASEKENKNDGKTGSDRFTSAIKVVFVIFVICVFMEFLIYKFVVPCLRMPVVSVTGQKSYTDEEIVALLRPMNVKNWFDFDVNSAVSILASSSGIDSVSVKKSFPNRIYVTIEEREPVAMTFVSSGDKSLAVYIDRNGVIFPEKFDEANNSVAIPIVSGIPVEHLSEGMRIPAKYRSLIDQISLLPKNYFSAISEICVMPKEYGNYELILIPSKSRIRVLTDRTLNEDALKYMMIVLDIVISNEPDVYEIDLRYGSVSYRKK